MTAIKFIETGAAGNLLPDVVAASEAKDDTVGILLDFPWNDDNNLVKAHVFTFFNQTLAFVCIVFCICI